MPQVNKVQINYVQNNSGHIDALGLGTRHLFKYVPLYSNALPNIKKADVFRITVPLDDGYSFDARIGEPAARVSKP